MFGGAGRFEDEPGGFGSVRPADRRGDDATKDVAEVATTLNVFRQLVGKIGSPSDSKQLRDQIGHTRSSFIQSVRVAKGKLQPQIESSDRSVKIQVDRLWQQLHQSVGSFEDVLKDYSLKEQRYPLSSPGTQYSSGVGFEETDMPPPSSTGRVTQVQEMESINFEQRQKERGQLMDLQRDMEDLHGMFVEMAAIVNDQSEVVKTIESNIESAGMKVEQAVQHTRKAADHQSKARHKKIIILVLVLVILAVIGAIIGGVVAANN